MDMILATCVMRSLSEPEKKVVAARQKWLCSNDGCRALLPAAYQVDHTIPLCDGGVDDISNCTAMCPNCHAEKTQLEGIARRRASVAVAEQYEVREDVFIDKGLKVRCTVCKRVRRADTLHSYCPGIEAPELSGLPRALARFEFKRRFFRPRFAASLCLLLPTKA